LDLPDIWQNAYAKAYQQLSSAATTGPRLLLATYFGGLGNNLNVLKGLPVQGLHVDLVRAPEQLNDILSVVAPDQVLSLGVLDGRNIWRTDLDRIRDQLAPVVA